jgi:hypothetical protein
MTASMTARAVLGFHGEQRLGPIGQHGVIPPQVGVELGLAVRGVAAGGPGARPAGQ